MFQMQAYAACDDAEVRDVVREEVWSSDTQTALFR
jgi:hypothetical protein